MQNRLRAAKEAAAQLVDKAKSLRPGPSGPAAVSDVDAASDDEDDEDLPGLDIDADAVTQELTALDDGDAEPVVIDESRSLFELLREIDPTPALPLTAIHEAGFRSLLRRLGEVGDTGLAEDRRVQRVLDLVGDRLSVAVGPEGITVRGLLRRRHTKWEHIGRLNFGGRYDLARGDGLAKMADDVKSRLLPIPIPGLSWLIRRVVGGVAGWLEQRFFTEEQVDSLKAGAGNALLGIERRGFDIELSGPLLLVSILAPGFSEAVQHEAERRGVKVEISGG